jgi:hypothetical protein
MTVHMDAGALGDSAKVEFLPNCRSRDACAASKPGRHCLRCSGSAPVNIERRCATRRANTAIEHAKFFAQTKECTRCGATFHPTPRNKLDYGGWAARQFCSRACAGRGVMERPEVAVRQQANLRAKFEEDADFRARHAASARLNSAKAALHKNQKNAGATRSRKAVGWIPDDFRPRYKRMREQFGAAKAKDMIREAMAAQARRAVADAARAMRERHQRDLASRY